MAPFVLLALALAVVALGAAVVAAVQFNRGVRRLRSTLQTSVERVRPLLDEATAEAAVTSTEVEALQASLAALRDEQSPGVRRQRPRVLAAQSGRGGRWGGRGGLRTRV